MNNGTQLSIYQTKSPSCLFTGYVDGDDNHCKDHGMAPEGYMRIAEDSPEIGRWLAEVRWIDINDVTAKNIAIPKLPGYIPTIGRGSAKLFEEYHPPVVAVKLADVVSPEKLEVIDSLEKRFGIPPGTQVVLQSYGKDRLIENLWPQRHAIFPKLASLGFAAVTAINYSVWFSQPHAERLINIKRSLLTYEELQGLNIPVIPHIYWSGKVNLDAWAVWLNDNSVVDTVAVNMQTMRSEHDWSRALAGFEHLASKLKRPIHFLITGPHTPIRIAQIKRVLPSMTLTNGSPARMAFASHKMHSSGLRIKRDYSPKSKSILFQENSMLYTEIMNTTKKRVSAKTPNKKYSGVKERRLPGATIAISTIL